MLRVYPTYDPYKKAPIGFEKEVRGNFLFTSSNYFDAVMDRSWFDDPTVEQMIFDIDKTKHIRGSVFESPMLGDISARELSGGVKGLILIYKLPQGARTFASGAFGDNCVEWLRRLSFMVDYDLCFTYPLRFFGKSEVMAQKYDTIDKNQRDFYICDEIWDYYIEKDRIFADYYKWDDDE